MFASPNSKGVPMILNHLNATEGGNSLVATLSGYFVRYRMVLYIFVAARQLP
jgi:hypothetical protein